MKRQAYLFTVLVAALSLVPGPALAMGLLEKPDPMVEKGNDLYKAGKYDKALQAYEEAAKLKPDAPEIQFDRGNALLKLGRDDDAKQAYESALAGSTNTLRSKDYYNLGNALAGMSQDDAAIRAYRRALQLDPNDANTRHNLEVMLWRKLRPQDQHKKPSPDGGNDKGDGGQPDAGPDGGARDGGSDGGSPNKPDGGNDGGGASDGGADGGQGDGGPSDGGQGNRGDGGQGDGGQGQGDGGEQRDGGPRDGGNQGQGSGADADGGNDGGPADQDQMADEHVFPDGGGDSRRKPISQQDAERILDSMRRNEKNLQLWKFKPKGVKRSHDVDKDW